ncbi:MAG: orotidine-5'-phosphate decarboxylase [Bacteroidetes bacterium]|nr:orotidine-5'-phosphate decarboxylase [Bacteroidota bacterium]
MNREQLIKAIRKKKSYLCVGLDTDISKIPAHLLKYNDPVFEFNKQIIEATKDYTVAYKINTAFYEAQGVNGWISLEKTLKEIPEDILTIADAKRGDIGNTADMYAKTFFETYPFDSVTVNPYMGADSVMPFLKHKDKWTIILALTSNPSSKDFQNRNMTGGKLYENVIKKAKTWGNEENMMFVVGATKPAELRAIRKLARKYFLLIPGVGAQGGDLKSISRIGVIRRDVGILVNLSRAIIYASDGDDFAFAAARVAKAYADAMSKFIK